MLDLARGLTRRVPLTKLLEMDATIRPYLVALMVSALEAAGETLVVPDTLKLSRVTQDYYKEHLALKASEGYNRWGRLGNMFAGSKDQPSTQSADLHARVGAQDLLK